MTLQDQERLAHVALNRFGLGAKHGSVVRIRADAKAAVLAELNTPNIALIAAAGLPTYDQACMAVHTDFNNEEAIREKELTARIAKHMEPEIGFVERLVLFFSNHFSMTVNKDGVIRATIGQLERDVIRKNILGHFEDILVGVMMHPAMIRYLDNDDSIGANSPIGLSWGVGLNHNLAREILELHTMGVGGGYTEADIHSLANIISGWSFVRGWEADPPYYNGGAPSNRGKFIFRRDWHEPGPQTLLGQSYAYTGDMTQGIRALRALARHPSTAQFIAYKLVRHFLTDEPTPELVNPVAQAFRSSRGNLKVVAQALVNLPQAWTLPLKKIRTPYELQIAEMRAMRRTYPASNRWPFEEPLRSLRHLPWERGAPDGYPDESVYWSGPDAMRIRVETAQLNAWSLQQLSIPYAHLTPEEIALGLFNSTLSSASRQVVSGITELSDGLAVIFMLPEFQRR